jgi:tetratricopeptide (TPR) repeat protein
MALIRMLPDRLTHRTGPMRPIGVARAQIETCMEISTTLQLAATYIQERNFADAEGVLTTALAKAKSAHDLNAETLIISELIELYRVKEPPDTNAAETLSGERELLVPSAASKWQTAMLLYLHKHEPAQTLARVNEAIADAKRTGDSGVAYSCLALAGLALLDLERIDEADRVLEQIEQVVFARQSFVVGDEHLSSKEGKTGG